MVALLTGPHSSLSLPCPLTRRGGEALEKKRDRRALSASFSAMAGPWPSAPAEEQVKERPGPSGDVTFYENKDTISRRIVKKRFSATEKRPCPSVCFLGGDAWV